MSSSAGSRVRTPSFRGGDGTKRSIHPNPIKKLDKARLRLEELDKKKALKEG